MPKKISAGIAIDGEKEFKQAVSDIDSSLKVMKSELGRVSAEYANNAKSAEALTAKKTVLQKNIDEEQKKVDVLNEALEKSKAAYSENAIALDNQKQKVKDASDALERAKKEYGENSEEVKKHEKALSDEEKKLNEVENAMRHSKLQTDKWAVSLNNAEADLYGMNRELKSLDEIGENTSNGIKKYSKDVEKAIRHLYSPIDRLKNGLNTILHPIQSAQNAVSDFGEKTKALRHPIETVKNKIDESSSAMERQRNKLELLASTYEDAKDNVAKLTKEYNASAKDSGVASDRTKKLADELDKAEKEAEDAENALNDYAKSVKKSGDESEESSSKVSKFADDLKKGIGTAAKVGAAGLAVAGAAIVKLSKDAVQGYADYEQLVGGVETLFGAQGMSVDEYAKSVGKSTDEVQSEYNKLLNAQNTVLTNSANAYKTAGLSQNEYMETVTSFSAALVKSLDGDTVKAASVADKAITDMSDNANKMGSDISSIQTAYQGFAKQNYTMLDNLKLGYGGTKEEMLRLLSDAEKLSGQKFDLSSYTDIVEAIHVVQTEMGITGTTAKEASTTIQGSLSSMKSAWDNLITGIADDNADLDLLVGNFVDSIATVGSTLIPRIQIILNGIGQLVQKMIPVIMENILPLISDTLPQLLDTAVSLFTLIIDAIIDNLPMITEMALQLVLTLTEGILSALPELVRGAIAMIATFASGLTQALPTLIPTIISVIMEIVTVLTDPTNLHMLIGSAMQMIIALADGLVDAVPTLIEAIPVLIENLVAALIVLLPEIIDSGIMIVIKLVDGIISAVPKLLQAGKDIIAGVKDGVKQKVDDAKTWGKDLIQNFIDGLKQKWQNLKNTVSDIAGSIKDFLGFSEPKLGPLSNFHTYAPDMMDLFINGIRDNESKLKSQIADTFSVRQLFPDKIDTEFNMLGIAGQIQAANPKSGTFTPTVGGGSSGGGDMVVLMTKMLELMTVIAANSDKQIILDSGAAIGFLSGGLNRSLGDDYTKKKRNN